MNYFYLILLVLAVFLSLKQERNTQRKKLIIGIYSVIIGIAILYNFGLFVGEMVYRIINT